LETGRVEAGIDHSETAANQVAIDTGEQIVLEVPADQVVEGGVVHRAPDVVGRGVVAGL
jgi:hypothetical protein